MTNDLLKIRTLVHKGGENLFIKVAKKNDAWVSILCRRDRDPEGGVKDNLEASILGYGFGKTKEKATKSMVEDVMKRRGDYVDDMYNRVTKRED